MTNKTVYILQGLPASGKSTWTENYIKDNPNQRVEVLSYDTYRQREPFASYEDINEREKALKTQLITDLRFLLLDDDYDVIIVDNTNLSQKSNNRIIQEGIQYSISKGASVHWEYVDHFLDVPVAECIRRDTYRDENKRVGPDVIFKLDKNARKLRGRRANKNLRAANAALHMAKVASDIPPRPTLIVDIDGTAAMIIDRSPYDGSRVYEDEVNYSLQHFILKWAAGHMFVENTTPLIVFLSGRENATLEEKSEGAGVTMVTMVTMVKDHTWAWLKDKFFQTLQRKDTNNDEFIRLDDLATTTLYMREEGDHRPDSEVKIDLFKQMKRDWPTTNVEMVIDDRDAVVSMWRRKLGLPCMQVNYGEF